jgi:hypothetical protein
MNSPFYIQFSEPWLNQNIDNFKLKILEDLGESEELIEDDTGKLVKSLVHKYKVKEIK